VSIRQVVKEMDLGDWAVVAVASVSFFWFLVLLLCILLLVKSLLGDC
jgi:hypothetical protein